MSTNFYIVETSVNTETHERVREETHIGKRAGGWTFMFNGMECKTLQEWKDRLANLPSNQVIESENRMTFTPDEFWAMVEETTQPWGPRGMVPRTHTVSAGPGREAWVEGRFSFSDYEFY